MLMQRRLLHCSRCVRAEANTNAFHLPTPSKLDPPSPPDPSIVSETLRVSLSPETMRKVSATEWTRDTRRFAFSQSANPLVQDQLRRAQQEVSAKFFRDGAKNKLKEALKSGKAKLPPIPAPHAVHCVITPVPKSFTASDVKRLVPFDKTKYTEHPLLEATRIYESNLFEQASYLLRFSHPSHLQDFLTQIPDIKVFNNELIAKLFFEDAAKSHFRPGTILYKGLTPTTCLRYREQYFRDFSGKSNLVMVSGVPASATLGMMTYMVQVMLENEKFEWAYEWKNRPGSGELFEPNVVPVGNGYTVCLMKLIF